MSDTQKHTKSNVPNLRFPGFEDEWKTRALGEIAEFSKGIGISKDQRSSEGNPCILYGELYTTYRSEIIDEIVSRTQLPKTKLVSSKANDVIIPASGETAVDISTARCVTQSGVLLGGDLNIIRLRKQDGRFFSYQLNGVRKTDIAKVSQGVSIVHLHSGDLARVQINYPSLEEQEKISSLLYLIDKRVSLQSKIIEHYESLIRVLYEMTFPKLSGITVNLGKIVQITKGEQLNSDNLHPIGKYYVMNGGITPSGYYDKYNTPEDTISISEGGNSCGYVQYNVSPFWSGGHCYSLLPLCRNVESLNYKYLYHYLKAHQKEIMAMRIGSGLPNIQKKDLEHFQVVLPNSKKQDHFTDLFNYVESIIKIEKDVLYSFVKQKAYLLNKMFI